jgi:hypothetical protein
MSWAFCPVFRKANGELIITVAETLSRHMLKLKISRFFMISQQGGQG